MNTEELFRVKKSIWCSS